MRVTRGGRKKVVSAHARREAVRVLCARNISERRSCQLISITRTSVRYRAQPRNDAQLTDELRAIAAKHPRFGYRRAHALVVRSGQVVNHKRVARLWRINALSLARRRPRPRRKVEPVRTVNKAVRPNEVWT